MNQAPNTVLAAALALAIGSPALSQTLTLDQFGGGLPGTSTFFLDGQPGSVDYLLLLDLTEQVTSFPALGITLDIPGTFVESSFAIPGFFGQLDASGQASASLVFPNAPIFESLTLSLQAIAGFGPYAVSNLIRFTPQLSGTFKPSLGQPLLPIVGGGIANGPNGELLFVGGTGALAQRYYSHVEQWQSAGATFGAGLFSQTTGLADGRVLFTGGLGLDGQPTADAAIYDPATQQTTTLTMGTARAGHGASLVGDGRVLITGGLGNISLTDPLALLTSVLGSTEFFDPNTDTFAPGPGLLEPRALHSSSSLTNGKVMIAGGVTLVPILNIPTVSGNAYAFDPATNSFGLPAFFGTGRFLHSAVGLSDGKVLLVGGLSLDLTTFLTTGALTDIAIGTLADCQLFTTGLFGLGTFTAVSGMQEGRAGAALAALPGGGALIAGGFQLTIDVATVTLQLDATATADRFAQGPNTIVPTGSMAEPRFLGLATPLTDGTVLVVGGGPATSEIYQL